MKHILIGTDSRGRNLSNYLARNRHHFPSGWRVRTFMLPGATIGKVADTITHEINQIRQHDTTAQITATIAAGICNLTEKIHHTHGMQIQYTRTQQKINTIITDTTSFIQHLGSLGIRAKIACIPPASLTKYADFNMTKGKLHHSIFTADALQSQQHDLEHDISIINKHLQTLHTNNGQRMVRWDRDLVRSSRKSRGRKNTKLQTTHTTSYIQLYDGVHPTHALSEKWFSYLAKAIGLDLMGSQKNEEEDTESESWDFKR
jgi:hypothetical protein